MAVKVHTVISRAVKAKKLTYAQFGKLCGVSTSTAHAWATGRSMSIRRLPLIAKVLDIDIRDLVA